MHHPDHQATDASSPPPASDAAKPAVPLAEEPTMPTTARLDPTRYGDWELNGKCVDF